MVNFCHQLLPLTVPVCILFHQFLTRGPIWIRIHNTTVVTAQPACYANSFCVGEVGKLEAVDYDEPQNGPPFKFQIDPKAPPAIKTKFNVQAGAGGDYYLFTKVSLDREEQKIYEIPIEVSRMRLYRGDGGGGGSSHGDFEEFSRVINKFINPNPRGQGP